MSMLSGLENDSQLVSKKSITTVFGYVGGIVGIILSSLHVGNVNAITSDITTIGSFVLLSITHSITHARATSSY